MTKFKEKLDEIDFSFDEEHWKDLEKRLDKKKKKRGFFYIILLAGLSLAGFAAYSYLDKDVQIPVEKETVSIQTYKKTSDNSEQNDFHVLMQEKNAQQPAQLQTIESAQSHVATANPKDGKSLGLVKKTRSRSQKKFRQIERNTIPPKENQGTDQNEYVITDTHEQPRSLPGERLVEHPDTGKFEYLRLDMLGWKSFRPHYDFTNTPVKPLPLVLKRLYKNELVLSRNFIVAPKAPNLESFNGQSYQLAYYRFLNKHLYLGLGLSLEYYRYSVPDYKIIYPDAIVKDQFMAYNGVSLSYKQLVPALSIGYELHMTRHTQLRLEAGIECFAVISSNKNIEVSYTVEYKYFDTMSRKADVQRVKHDRQEQKNLGLNPLPAYQFTYFAKAGLGVDIWKHKLGVRASIEYRRLPVLGFVQKTGNHLLMPGASLFFRF